MGVTSWFRRDTWESAASRRSRHGIVPLTALLCLCVVGCRPRPTGIYQGYLEGEFLDFAPAVGGRLEQLAVRRGDPVTNGQPLFVLEADPERFAVQEANERMRQAEARLDDLRKGLRPSELDALRARLEHARATAALAQSEWDRAERLFAGKTISENELDRARQQRMASTALVTQLQAEVETGQLGGRPDQVRAAEQDLAAARAVLARAEWALAQKRASAPASGWVHDTYYEPGEFVRSNAPVLSLLPQGQVRIRFFVPEAEVERFAKGTRVRVLLNPQGPERSAEVVYVATQPEYTPPVIFSRQTRAKLTYMIEARPESDPSLVLHPGQPVEVRL